MSEEEKREFRERGAEGVIARKYPQLYEKLKEISERTGQSILDLLASYTNWALEIREFSSMVTQEDLANITPESLYASLKLLMFFEERYIRLISYMNVANALAIFNALRELLTYSTTAATAQQTTAPLLPLVPPQPSRVERLIDAILRGIEMATLGSEGTRRQLAREIAEEIVKLASQQQTPSEVKAESK